MPRLAILLALCVALLVPAATAHATVVTNWTGSGHPAGWSLTANRVLAIATATPQVQREARKAGGSIEVRTQSYLDHRWQVQFLHSGNLIAEVHIDDRTGRVLAAYTGTKAIWRGARGSKALTDEGETGKLTNATWLWVLLCVLFVGPFVDPKRPFRWLHLDLLALLAFALPHILLDHGLVRESVFLSFPVLAYLMVRLIVLARGRQAQERLVPFAPQWLLGVGALALFVARAVMNLVDSVPNDVAYAGVAGADRIAHGLDLYSAGGQAYDTYGPVNYLLYWPFEQILPITGEGDPNLWAAHAAAITFDALIAVGLFFIGRRISGRVLGLILVYAWFAYPYTWYALSWNSNDGTVALLVIPALLALGTPAVAGVMLGLAATAKFSPAILGPLIARQIHERRGVRGTVVFVITSVVVAVVAIWVYLPDGGVREFYDATIGFQLGRDKTFSIWGLTGALSPVHVLVQVGMAALAVVSFVFLRRLSLAAICAWVGALILVLQMALSYWVEPYIVWFAPFALVAFFTLQHQPGATASPRKLTECLRSRSTLPTPQ